MKPMIYSDRRLHYIFIVYQNVNEKRQGRGNVLQGAKKREQDFLRRTRRDFPDLTRNAAHQGINQRFPGINESDTASDSIGRFYGHLFIVTHSKNRNPQFFV
jgi:hypothetical protein